MSVTTNLCLSSCVEFVGRSQKLRKRNSASSSFSNSPCSSSTTTLSFSRSFKFTSAAHKRSPASFRMTTPVAVKVNASATVEGVPDNKLEASSTGTVGASDLLIVGPGVLGRIVAEKWREEYPGSQIHGQTLTSDHHDELIKMGISPSLKGTQLTHKFPYVIFCAPPYGSPDYPGEVREATLNWNGEGSFLFTSSSAPYDCSDNGSCDELKRWFSQFKIWLIISEDTPVVPIGRSPR
ncbi:UNVERIFIED_CONTAM: hypothetical protein Sradi_1665500 [Sesamum radiatum]|uniref:Uncharacterized protein n=1 Tax=Sesamum radiatum TaxID=300843 RepID=A0AAW2UCW3_SESRA